MARLSVNGSWWYSYVVPLARLFYYLKLPLIFQSPWLTFPQNKRKKKKEKIGNEDESVISGRDTRIGERFVPACRYILLSHVTFIVPPRISPFYFENGVTEGMRTQLMCTTSQGDQPFNITWLMDDKPIQVRPGDGASVSSSASSSSGGSNAAVVETGNNIQISDYPPFSSILTINNVSAKHSGNYTCQISNVAGLAEYSTSLSVAGWCLKRARTKIDIW